MKKPYALIIMDGFGVNEREMGNAIKSAKTPNIDKLMATCPNTVIHASGMDVGLPEGQMGVNRGSSSLCSQHDGLPLQGPTEFKGARTLDLEEFSS